MSQKICCWLTAGCWRIYQIYTLEFYRSLHFRFVQHLLKQVQVPANSSSSRGLRFPAGIKISNTMAFRTSGLIFPSGQLGEFPTIDMMG